MAWMLSMQNILRFLAVVVLAGCAAKAPISEARYQQALALVDQGVLSMREGRLDEADAAFSVAHDLVPLAAAVDGRGCVALLQGEWEDAERFFEEAYMMDQSYDKAAANLALLLDIRGEPDRARELYKWYLDRHPDDAGVRNNMAALDFDRGTDRDLILQELLRAAAISRHGVIIDNITHLEGFKRETW